ncbi:MAG: nucleotidyltransferase domain-containing protein [Natronospirillum sp.]
MRLTAEQRHIIQTAVNSHFGTDCELWLFGSRVDDNRKGGDIDLYIEIDDMDASDLVDHRLALLRDLHRALGEQKIDLVIKRASRGVELPIYQIVRETGVRLQ